MKLLIGFIFGILVASAMAQTAPGYIKTTGINAFMAAGVGPDGTSAAIKVDHEGHVICSKE